MVRLFLKMFFLGGGGSLPLRRYWLCQYAPTPSGVCYLYAPLLLGGGEKVLSGRKHFTPSFASVHMRFGFSNRRRVGVLFRG